MNKMMKNLTDEGIIERVIKGASLRTVMIPDDAMPSNNPLHIESYDLPNVIVNGGYFWGKSETAHLGQTLGQPPRNTGSFCYTNIGNIFSYFSHDPNTLILFNKKRYKSHSWRAKGNFRLVWDSLLDRSSVEVKKEIESGSKFKIAMLDSEYIWNIHPIDLPMYFPKENRFELKTTMDWYPTFFRYPQLTRDLLEKYQDFFNMKQIKNEGKFPHQPLQFSSFYVVRSDGSYYNYFDIQRGTTQKYKRLKIFVDNVNRTKDEIYLAEHHSILNGRSNIDKDMEKIYS